MRTSFTLIPLAALCLPVAAVLSLLPAAAGGQPEATHSAHRAGSAEYGTWGVELRYRDPSIDPGDDFYRHVNQGWLEQAELPQGFSSNNQFVELALATEAQIEDIVESVAEARHAPGTPERKIATLFASFMNVDLIERLGVTPLAVELARVLAIETHAGIARAMGRPFHSSLVSIGVRLDPGNPDRYVLATGQSGLGLPGRDYYLRFDAPFPGHRAAYVEYIAATLARAGLADARRRAADIMAFETELASVHWPRTKARDRVRNYNLMGVSELKAYAPGFPWRPLLAELGVADQTEIVVATDSAVRASSVIYAKTPVPVLRDYLVFHYLNNHASLLSSEWDDARFDFFARRLRGVEAQRERKKRGIQFVNNTLGELLGRIYVQRHFPPSHRAQMETLVDYLRSAFEARLQELAWMDAETRSAALAKLASFETKIAYPRRWRDYSDLELAADELVGNAHRIAEWSWTDARSKLGEPRRDWEWGMTPQTVNAYYAPTRNEIVFPAAILQPPYFDPNADPAVNFGAIGAVIGHEMGHGFDDQGSRSDARGLLRNWWTADARRQFEARASELVAQYEVFSPIDGLSVNGQLTLGENIGDLGGLTIAYHAYRLYVADKLNGAAPVIDGLTGDQRFFMAWAQMWRHIATDDARRQQLLVDVHSPAEYRVNGVVRNMDAWYEAFDVAPDDALYLPPEDRIRIW